MHSMRNWIKILIESKELGNLPTLCHVGEGKKGDMQDQPDKFEEKIGGVTCVPAQQAEGAKEGGEYDQEKGECTEK